MKNNTNKKRKLSVMAVCLLLTVIMAAGATLAYIFTSTSQVVNTFTPPKPDITVKEEFDGNVKKAVAVTNTGDVDSFIRAKVVITWQNEAGEVYPLTPVAGESAGTADYRITWNKEGWVYRDADGFYYYTSAVPKGSTTGNLFTDAEPLRACPDENYKLHIEVISQSVQAEPITAVQETWGVTIADGNVTPAPTV